MATGGYRKGVASTKMRSGKGIERSRDDNWRETRTSAECLSYLCLSEHLSDISFTFIADKSVKLPAHKFVLSMRSAVFEAMFYGSLSESGNTVLIKDVQPQVMKVVLQYIYSDKPEINGNNVLPCLYTAKKYDLTGLVQQCSNYLKNNIDESNVCSVHEQAVLYEMKPLQDRCLSFIFENAASVLSSPDFLKLSHETLIHILKQDELAEDEIKIFQAAIRWAKHSKESSKGDQTLRNQLGEALYQIRFPIMPIEEFANVVAPSGILTNEELLLLYQYNATKGSTTTGKFRIQKRSGAPVTVAFSGNAQHQTYGNCNGCFLTIGYGNSSTGFPFPTNQKQPGKKSIKIKSVTGTFIEQTKGININGSRRKDYEVKGNKIIFNIPIEMSDHFNMEFLFDNDIRRNNGNDSMFNLGFSSHITCTINQKENIKGQAIFISQIADGLESITFV